MTVTDLQSRTAPATLEESSSRWAYVVALAPIIFGITYVLTTEFLPPHRLLLAALMRSLPTELMLTLLPVTLALEGLPDRSPALQRPEAQR